MTAGSCSLRELLPSAKNFFYIKKMLKQQQLIKAQVMVILLALVQSGFCCVFL